MIRPLGMSLVLALLLLGCSSTGSDASSSGAAGAGPLPSTVAEMAFEQLTPWARPIDDYQQAGYQALTSNEFLRGIHDLAVYDDRLYLGYGDANENLGSVIPIELRSFASHQDDTAVGEFATDEEQVQRYRVLDGRLWVAGIDATEDAWLGNIYVRGVTEPWSKSRTLDGGVHVHDVAAFGGEHFAVGSGSQQAEWEQGDIYAHLWRSADGGASFDVAERVHNGGDGDARYTRLLPVGDELYLFGYTSDAQFQIDNLIGGRYDGSTLTMFPDSDPLRWLFAIETDPVAGQRGLLRAVDIMAPTLRHASYLLDGSGPQRVEALVGNTVVDAFHHPDSGETLILSYEGDDYIGSFMQTEWNVHISVTSDFVTFTELLSFSTFAAPSCIAFWRGALFYGDDNGQVWRALRI